MPAATDTAYSITVVYRYSSQDAHGTKLIDQCSFGMRSIGCSSRHLLLKLLLIYSSVCVSSSSPSSLSSSSSYSLLFCFSLRLPLACTSTSLRAISLRFHSVSFHAAVCCQAGGSYIVPGATLLRAVLIWYIYDQSVVTASTCYTSRFRLTALSSFSFLILLLLILLLLLLLFSSRGDST